MAAAEISPAPVTPKFINMSRYYFDVHNGGSILDETGSEHSDMEGVRNEARRSLVELAYSFVAEKDTLQLRVDVRDSAGKRVLTAALLMVIDEADQLTDHLA